MPNIKDPVHIFVLEINGTTFIDFNGNDVVKEIHPENADIKTISTTLGKGIRMITDLDNKLISQGYEQRSKEKFDITRRYVGDVRDGRYNKPFPEIISVHLSYK